MYCPGHFLDYSLKQIDGVNKAPPAPSSMTAEEGPACGCVSSTCASGLQDALRFANITPTPLATTPCETISHPPLH